MSILFHIFFCRKIHKFFKKTVIFCLTSGCWCAIIFDRGRWLIKKISFLEIFYQQFCICRIQRSAFPVLDDKTFCFSLGCCFVLSGLDCFERSVDFLVDFSHSSLCHFVFLSFSLQLYYSRSFRNVNTFRKIFFIFFSVLKNAHQFHYTIFKNKKQYLKYKKNRIFLFCFYFLII